jgi:hypothetical protein
MMDNNVTKVNENHLIGKKLPVSTFMVFYEMGVQMCFRECEAYALCLSINFNRKMLMCELNRKKRNKKLILVDDEDFTYREIPDVVSFHIYQYFCSVKMSAVLKLDKIMIQIRSAM